MRRRLSIELVLLGVCATGFLLVFPERPWGVDVGLALLALGFVGLNAKFTRRVVWSQFAPSDGHMSDHARRRKCFLITLTVTACLVLMLLVLAMGIAYAQGGWDQALAQVLTWHLLPAIGLFFPWALLQQTLFQFYLLGRLRTVIPTRSPLFAIVLTGISYAMTHLPDLTVALVTSLMGVFWTSMYYSFRMLTPIALSHAVLGAGFYYWIYGRDLLDEWLGSVW
ncbi:MAG: CPBP family glutamic-type intramembrane protease [Gammaproteobacteria bacterium]